jgi:hypothetical protein
MPPDNARYLTRLDGRLGGAEQYLCHTQVFDGLETANGGAMLFRSMPVTPGYISACDEDKLPNYMANGVPIEPAVRFWQRGASPGALLRYVHPVVAGSVGRLQPK